MSEMNIQSDSVFYWSVCHVCKRYNEKEKLMRCGKCKMMYYCSKEHQKEHWPLHKSVCRAICKYIEEKRITFTKGCRSVEEWCNMRTMFSVLVELTLKRPFMISERQMILFPKLCEFCKIRCDEGTDCENCLCVNYCSVDHQLKDSYVHQDKCSKLKLCRNLDLFQNNASKQNSIPGFYIRMPEEMSNFSKDMSDFISNYVVVTESKTEEDKMLCSELLSCPLSLLYGLLQTEVFTKDRLVVHIIGADQFECCMPSIWETVLHWLLHIKQLNLVFVGPDIVREEHFDHLCKKCSEQKKQLCIEMYNVFYEEYIESENTMNPDIIAMFNAGLHEYEGSNNDTWSQALPHILKFRNIPIIMTAYTQLEAEKDIRRLACDDTVQTKCSSYRKNPFASLRPYRDWAGFHSDVFYNNNFISFFKVTS